MLNLPSPESIKQEDIPAVLGEIEVFKAQLWTCLATGQSSTQDRLLTIKQVAERMGCSYQVIRGLIHSGDLPSTYRGKRIAVKLPRSAFACRKAILIYGFDYPTMKLEPAIHAFELLACDRVELGERVCSNIPGTLVHPVHSTGKVFAWEIQPTRT